MTLDRLRVEISLLVFLVRHMYNAELVAHPLCNNASCNNCNKVVTNLTLPWLQALLQL